MDKDELRSNFNDEFIKSVVIPHERYITLEYCSSSSQDQRIPFAWENNQKKEKNDEDHCNVPEQKVLNQKEFLTEKAMQATPGLSSNALDMAKKTERQIEFVFNSDPTIRGILMTKDIGEAAIKETVNIARTISYPFLKQGLDFSEDEIKILEKILKPEELQNLLDAKQAGDIQQVAKYFDRMMAQRHLLVERTIANKTVDQVAVNNLTQRFRKRALTDTDKFLLNKRNQIHCVQASKPRIIGMQFVPMVKKLTKRYSLREKTIQSSFSAVRYVNSAVSITKNTMKFVRYKAKLAKLAATKAMEVAMKTKLGKKIKETAVVKESQATIDAVKRIMEQKIDPVDKVKKVLKDNTEVIRKRKKKKKTSLQKRFQNYATRMIGERFAQNKAVKKIGSGMMKIAQAFSALKGYILAIAGGAMIIMVICVLLLVLINSVAQKLDLGNYVDLDNYASDNDKKKTYIMEIGEVINERYDDYMNAVNTLMNEWTDQNYNVSVKTTDKKSDTYNSYNDDNMEDPTIFREETNTGEIIIMTYAAFDYDIKKKNIDEAKEYAKQLFNGSHEIKVSANAAKKKVTLECITYYFNDLYECELAENPGWDKYASSEITMNVTTSKNAAENRDKLYSVLKYSKRFDDEMIAAIIGVWSYESNGPNQTGVDPGAVESRYSGYQSVASVEQLDQYTRTHHFSSDYYCSGAAGRQYGKYVGKWLCGIGLAGYTYGRAGLLLDFAQENNIDWRSVDTQLIWICKPAQRGWSNLDVKNRGDSADLFANVYTKHFDSLDNAVTTMMLNYEGCLDTGVHLANAKLVYAEMSEYEVDEDYAKQILESAGMKQDSTGRWIRR